MQKYLLIAVALLMVATGYVFTGGAAEDEVVTLHFASTEDEGVFDAFIEEFESRNPGVQVRHESIPFEQFGDVLEARIGQGDSSPDIFTADMPAIGNLVHRGFLMELTDEFDTGEVEALHLPASMNAVTVDNRLYALPVSTSTMMLYYNVDLLEEAGITPPSTDPAERWTWEETRERAIQAQEAGARWGFLWDQVSRIYQLQPLPESLGGGSGVRGALGLELDIVNDEWIEGFEFYAAIFEDGIGPRGVPGPGQTAELFADGQVAFFVGGPWWTVRLFSQRPDLNFGAGAHPYFEGGEPVTPTGSWAWGVNPHTENKELALKFVEFASMDAEGALLAADQQPIPPANTEALETYINDPLFNEGAMAGTGELMRHELSETARVRPETIGYLQFESIINEAIEDIRNGAPVERRLQEAENAIDSAFRRFR